MASNWSVARLTCMAETSSPHNSSVIGFTLRVERPWTHVPAAQSKHTFRQSDHQYPIAAQALLQDGRIKASCANLWHCKGDFAYPGADCLGLVSVGMTLSFLVAFILPGLEVLLSLCLHGLVDQDANKLRYFFPVLVPRGLLEVYILLGKSLVSPYLFWSPYKDTSDSPPLLRLWKLQKECYITLKEN